MEAECRTTYYTPKRLPVVQPREASESRLLGPAGPFVAKPDCLARAARALADAEYLELRASGERSALWRGKMIARIVKTRIFGIFNTVGSQNDKRWHAGAADTVRYVVEKRENVRPVLRLPAAMLDKERRPGDQATDIRGDRFRTFAHRNHCIVMKIVRTCVIAPERPDVNFRSEAETANNAGDARRYLCGEVRARDQGVAFGQVEPDDDSLRCVLRLLSHIGCLNVGRRNRSGRKGQRAAADDRSSSGHSQHHVCHAPAPFCRRSASSSR